MIDPDQKYCGVLFFPLRNYIVLLDTELYPKLGSCDIVFYTSNYVCGNHTELQLCSLFSGRKGIRVWLAYNYKDVLLLTIMDVQDSSHAFTLTMGLLKAACLE